MKLTSLCCFILAFSTMPALAQDQAADTTASLIYLPDEADIAMITSGVAERLLDPESARVSGIVAAHDPENRDFIHVCGRYQGRNGFGGYAQPAMFKGALTLLPEAKKAFLVFGLSDGTPAIEGAYLEQCLIHFPEQN